MSCNNDNLLRLQETPPATSPPPAGFVDFFINPATGDLIRRNSAGVDEIVGQDAFGYDPAVATVKIVHASRHGALADGVTLYDGVYTSGSALFTSASAEFTQEDVGKSIVLQLSQTTRQILTIQSVADANNIVLSANASASSSAYTAGITTYGTDNSAAIQAALTACGAAGGGTVQLDGGVYLCIAAPSNTSTINSIFVIPHTDTIAAMHPAISIKGVGIPGFSYSNPGQLPNISGTIIYCPNQTVTGTDPAIFAVVGTNYTGGYWVSGGIGSTNTTFRMENVTVRQPPAPKMHGIQAAQGGGLFLDNVSLDVDVPSSSATNLLIAPNTGGASSVGIFCPTAMCGYYSDIGRVYVHGYDTGIKMGDTTRVAHATLEFCRYGVTFSSATNAMIADFLGIYRCQTPIFATNSISVKVLIGLANIEVYRGGGVDFCPSWCQNPNGNFEIDDPYGSMQGRMVIHSVLAGTGPIPTSIRTRDDDNSGPVVYDLVTKSWIGGEKMDRLVLAPPITPSVAPTLSTSGTAGSTSYTYRIGYKLPNGSIVFGPSATIATGNATLTGTNKINITIPSVNGCATAVIYRTASSGTPSTTGNIGHCFIQPSGSSFSDTGIAGDGTKPIQTSASLVVPGMTTLTLTNYADDTAAGTAGLTAGMLYQTSGAVKVKQ